MFKRWLILALLALPLLAQEAVTPDTIAAQSGYTDCTLAEIDEDPDSSGTDWCDVADANDVTTTVRVTFNTPSGGDPSGTQEFRAQLRKTSQSTDPSCVGDLYENGSEVSAGVIADTTISATSEVVLSGTWNASSLGTSDGSLVELLITCTPGAGNPNNRASGEVGAVEWVAATAAPPKTGTGSLTITANAAMAGESIAVGAGSLSVTTNAAMAGESIAVGTGVASLTLGASAAGESIAVGTGSATITLGASIYIEVPPEATISFPVVLPSNVRIGP